MTRYRILAVLILAIACTACGSRGTYEEPLIRGGVLEGEAPANEIADALAPAPARAAPSSRQDDDLPTYYDTSWSLGGSADRLADLSPGSRPSLDSDEGGWWMMVDRFEEKVKTAGNLVRDEELNEYVNSVTCQIAGDYCGDIRVYLVRNPIFNAFMWPNGMMVVHTGLLLRMHNEAQLATVLGHEIGHYLRRHSLQRLRDIKTKATFLAMFSVALNAAGSAGYGNYANLADLVVTVGTLESIAAFGRENERESDGYGLLMMAKAGYDPREASKIWGQMLREYEADEDYDGPPLFFSTHPPSEERRAALADLGERVVRQMTVEPVRGRESYVSIMLPRRADFLKDELNLRNFDRTEMLLDMLIEDNVNLAELHYFKGELYRLRGKEGDEERALERYYVALSEPGTVPP